MKVHIEYDMVRRINAVWLMDDGPYRRAVGFLEGDALMFREVDPAVAVEPTFLWTDDLLDAFREALADRAPKVDEVVHRMLEREAARVDRLIAYATAGDDRTEPGGEEGLLIARITLLEDRIRGHRNDTLQGASAHTNEALWAVLDDRR